MKNLGSRCEVGRMELSGDKETLMPKNEPFCLTLVGTHLNLKGYRLTAQLKRHSRSGDISPTAGDDKFWQKVFRLCRPPI